LEKAQPMESPVKDDRVVPKAASSCMRAPLQRPTCMRSVICKREGSADYIGLPGEAATSLDVSVTQSSLISGILRWRFMWFLCLHVTESRAYTLKANSDLSSRTKHYSEGPLVIRFTREF
jgi:hypothetical protein